MTPVAIPAEKMLVCAIKFGKKPTTGSPPAPGVLVRKLAKSVAMVPPAVPIAAPPITAKATAVAIVAAACSEVPPNGLSTLKSEPRVRSSPETVTWCWDCSGRSRCPPGEPLVTSTLTEFEPIHVDCDVLLMSCTASDTWGAIETVTVTLDSVVSALPNVSVVSADTTTGDVSAAGLLFRWSWSKTITLGV